MPICFPIAVEAHLLAAFAYIHASTAFAYITRVAVLAGGTDLSPQ